MSGKRRGLGRGLDALLVKDAAPVRPAAGASLLTLPLGRLKPNRLQPRSDFDEEGLAELAESIRAQGVVQPIVVTPAEGGEYTIVAGERRWRAARRAGLDEVPVVVRQVAGDRQLLEMALVENLQRADLNPMEEAEAYRALRESFGLSQEEVARQVGKGRSAVANALRLLKLSAPVQDMLRDGRLTAGQARPLLALAEEPQLALAERAVSEGLSARRLEELAARGAKKTGRRERRVDADTAAAEERLTRRLQTKVEIHRRGAGGSVVLRFHSEEELMRLYDLLIQVGGKR